LFYGEYPNGIIDHIDGNRSNNAIENLRILDAAENTHNIRKAYSSNKTTGLLGANYCKENKKYLARIMVRGKMHNVGRFKTAQEAHDAYMRAKAILHPASVAAAEYVKGKSIMSNLNRSIAARVRPLASIPQKEGFQLIGVHKNGSEALLTVFVDKDGFHKVPGYHDLAGWKLK